MEPRALSDLLAVPLQSAVRAQAMAADETLRFVRDFGTTEGIASVFSVRVLRTVEETVRDPETGKPTVRFVERPLEIKVPLLSLVPMPAVQLSSIDVDLGVRIVDTKPEAVKDARGKPATSLASAQAVYANLARPEELSMKFTLHVVQRPAEGLARLSDMLTELIGGKTPPEKGGLGKLQTLEPAEGERLREHGLDSLERIASLATERAGALPRIAERVGVSETRLRSLIEEARKALAEEPTKKE